MYNCNAEVELIVNSDKKKRYLTISRISIIKAIVPYLIALAVIVCVVLLISCFPKFVMESIVFIMCYGGFFAWIYTFKIIGEKIDEKINHMKNHETKSIILTMIILTAMGTFAVKLWEMQ
jgi:hypothetical protein